jgi:hypothetical protein
MLGATDVTQVTMLIGACGALGSVIGIMWRQMVSHFNQVDEQLKETQKSLNDCQEDRLAIWKQLAKQAGMEVEQLKNGNSHD